MTPIALMFLVLAIVLVWGGLAVSTVALMRSSKRENDPHAASHPRHLS